MEILKRLFVLLLALVMVVGMLPMTYARATEAEEPTVLESAPNEITSEEIILDETVAEDTPVELVSEIGDSAMAGTYGECGDNLSWELKNGTLTISGSGEMYNFDLFSPPWKNQCDQIERVVVHNGVTSIGEFAFQGCTSLTSIEIPGSVTSIGVWAFAQCSGLSKIVFTGDAPAIDSTAFAEVKAKAYYPGSNSTWTAAKRNNYGGTLTWVAQSAFMAPNVSASNDAKTGKIKLTWNKVDGAAKYEVYLATSKTGTYKLSKTITGTTFTHTDAVAGKTYYYKVKSVAADGIKSDYSNIISATCDLARPEVTSTNVASSGKNHLTWKVVDGTLNYQVYRATSKTGTYKLVKTTTGTSYTDTAAVAGTTYYYRVRAIHKTSAASSANSAVVSRVCDLARPALTATNVASSGKNHLTWKAIDGTLNYQVYRATSKTGTYKLVKTTTGTSYTDTSAVAGTTYYYRVRAIHKNSAASSANSAVVSRVCDLARPEISVALSSNKPKVSWKKVSGTTKYEVYVATSKTGTYKLIKTTTGTSFTHTAATKGTTYYYRVRAIHSNSAASSANSAVKYIKSK